MRVLNVEEYKSISGGYAPGVAGVFTKSGMNAYTNIGNGFITTISCKTPMTFNFTLGISTTGKVIDANTGGGASIPQDCTVTTINTRTGIQTICEGTVCSSIDTNTGKKISEIDNSRPFDTGLASVTAGNEYAVAESGTHLGGGYVGGDGVLPPPPPPVRFFGDELDG
jgi:hypothetical protein